MNRLRGARLGATALAAATAATLALAGPLALATATPAAAMPAAAAAAPAGALAVHADSLPGCTNPVASWSIAQRVEQLIMVSGQFSNLGASTPMAADGVGGFVLFGQPSAGSGPAIQAGIAGLDATSVGHGQVPAWMSTDEEGGPIARLANVIGSLPSPRQMAAQWTPAQVEQVMATHGSAMRSLGITMDLAPVLDTASPSDPVAGESYRSFSQNGTVAGAYGSAYAAGLRAAGVVAVGKHFPGLGHANADTDTARATDPPLSSLESDDLIPFRAAVSAGLPVVMVGHPIVPGLTGGLPASLSPATYQLLRGSLHFGGVALTDDLNAVAISAAGYSQPAAAVRAIESGADMVMIDAGQWTATAAALNQAVMGSHISVTALDASVGRIVAAKGTIICPTVGIVDYRPGGYWLAAAAGSVSPFGAAPNDGEVGVRVNQPVVGMAGAAGNGGSGGNGYWLVAADGGVFPFGPAAHFYGSTGSIRLNQPVVGMASTPSANGYWLVAADGGIFPFGPAAHFYGSTGNIRLNRPVVGMAGTVTGNGYWLVAADGGLFPFGPGAHFYGSTGNIRLNQPVVGMAATPSGHGYWLVARDGGIFPFGDAHFYGSTGNIRLNQPIVGMAATPSGHGYWLVARDGGIFPFGDAHFYGSGG